MALPVEDPTPIRSTRTEQELVADAIWRLYDSGVILRTPNSLARACAAACVPIAAVREASARLLVPGRYQRPGDRVVEIRSIEPPALLKRAPTVVREERDGKLFCRAHEDGAGAWVPVADFGWRRDQRTPRRKSWCRDCVSKYQKARYLSAARQQLINCDTVATLLAGDPLLRGRCPNCLKRFKAGERVVAATVHLAHEECVPAPAVEA